MLKHSHQYAVLAILLGILSLGISISAKIYAEETSIRSYSDADSKSTTSIAIACSYVLSDWSICDSSGKQTRAITSKTPERCYEKEVPVLERTCNYIKPVTPCNYTYSSWSECDSSGKQFRTIKEKTPSGCVSTATPVLEQSCTYANSTSAVACEYVLSYWSTCDSFGVQTRSIRERKPIGCYDKNIPSLQQTCTSEVFSVVTNSESVAYDDNDSSNVTPSFHFLNLNGGEVISGILNVQGSVKGARSVEFYLVPNNSNTSKYLGLAKNVSNGTWEYSFDSNGQPNGSFLLEAKIKNAYGVYSGERKMIVILNAREKSVNVSTTGLLEDLQKSGDEKVVQEENKSNIQSQISKEWQEKNFKSTECQDEKICGSEADPDFDGLNNEEEYRYKTSPTDPDSDGDGYLDGDEIKNGYNPLKASPGDKSDKIIFESPKDAGEIKKELYQVSNIELAKKENGERALKISGKGIPNSFVTIYIYSDPIVFTVKTDSDGNWSYELDKDLENGNHQIYVAVTDNTGKITSKSEPLAFIKTAEAVNVIHPVEAAASEKAASPTATWSKNSLIFIVALVIGALALALASIGLYKHSALKKEVPEINNAKEE